MKAYVALGMAAAMVSTVAQAQEKQDHKVGLQVRLDNTSTYSKLGEEDQTYDGQSFGLQTARFNLTGDVNEQVKYFLRVTTDYNKQVEYTKVSDSKTGMENYLGFDRAYVDFSPMAMLKIRAGLMQAGLGANENLFYSPFDTYTTSKFRSDILAKMAELQAQGVEFEVAPVADHKVAIQILNAKDVAKGEKNINIVYKGDVNKMVKPIFTYSMMNHAVSEENADRVVDTAYSLGAQVLVNDATIDVEYNTYAQAEDEDLGIVDATTVAGYAFGLGYNVKDFGVKPLLKYASHAKAVGEDDPTNYTNMSLAVECRPTASDFRYHVGYVTETEDSGDADTLKVTTKYLLGTALKI
jgi:hypothetical protein